MVTYLNLFLEFEHIFICKIISNLKKYVMYEISCILHYFTGSLPSIHGIVIINSFS